MTARDQGGLTCKVHPRWTRASQQPLLKYGSRGLSKIASLSWPQSLVRTEIMYKYVGILEVDHPGGQKVG